MDGKRIKRFAVFASGRGSNFSAIMREVRAGRLKIDVVLLVSDNPAAPVIARARAVSVPVAVVARADFPDKASFEGAILETLKRHKIEAIILAGFMRVLSPAFVRRFRNRIINIHPALLPAFKGAHAIADAFCAGVKVTGVTVHFVDEHVDNGPVILQEPVPVAENDTLESLEKKIHAAEHRVYPRAIRLFASGKLRVKGRRVEKV